MSVGVKIPLKMAIGPIERVKRELRLDEAMVAGSIRRERQLVGDIDLLCPLPAPGARDVLCDRIAERFTWRGVEGGLIQPVSPAAGSLGWIEKGCKTGFKFCCLTYVEVSSDGAVFEIPLQIQRYVPGPMGNLGFELLLRTGPREFGMAVLERYKLARARGPVEVGLAGVLTHLPAAELGFLLDREGRAVPTPTEEEVFRMSGLPFISPRDRDQVAAEKILHGCFSLSSGGSAA